MLRELVAAATIVGVIAGFAGDAIACKGEKVLFEEDFSTFDRTWGDPGENFQMQGGKATAKPPPNQAQWRFNPAFAFDDSDVCLTVTSIETSNPAESSAGIMFWAKDRANSYVFAIASNWFYVVQRLVALKWTTPPIPWTKSDAIAVGQGKPNVLRVTTKGQTVTLFINDTQVTRFRAQAPEGATHIGLYMASGPAKPDTWEFSVLKVTSAPN